MSTRSRIGMLNEDGSVTSIYCHFDGYPEGVGQKLQDFWGESVRPLLALGALSVLGEVIGADEGPKSFEQRRSLPDDDPRNKWCLAYHRDRGEQNVGAKTHPENEWPDSGQEYEYLWTGREWLVREVEDQKWQSLARVLGR